MTDMFEDKNYSADFPVICMDTHIFEDPIILTEYLDPKYREMANYVLKGDTPGLGDLVAGKEVNAGYQYRMHMDTEEAYEVNLKEGCDYRFPGEHDAEVRLSCMDFEHIDAGIVRNTTMAGMYHLPPAYNDLVEALCVAYNNWVYDFCQADPNRLYPEALLPCHDMELALKEMERTAKLGFKSTVLPGSTATGCPLSDPHWDPLFSCMEEAGWPLFIHPAFDVQTDSAAQFLCSPAKMNSSSAAAYQLMFYNLNFMLDNIVTLGEITLGGMLDKHPNLNVCFIESGSSWASEVLYRLDKDFHVPWAGLPPSDTWVRGMELKAKTPPSELAERQVYFMFEGGDRGQTKQDVERRANNLIWCSDIPHYDADGPWEGGGCLRYLDVNEADQKLIMGGNAAKLLDIPYEKRVGTSKNTKPIPEWALPAVA